MANKGNPSRQPVWLVLLALCLFASSAFDFTSLLDTDALEGGTQARFEHPDRADEDKTDDIAFANTDNYRLSAGSQLPEHRVTTAPFAISDAYPPDNIHGPPTPYFTTV